MSEPTPEVRAFVKELFSRADDEPDGPSLSLTGDPKQTETEPVIRAFVTELFARANRD